MIGCPECGAAVQPDWDWCHACGFDPDGTAPAAGATVAARPSELDEPRRELPGRPAPAHPEVLRSELVPLADRSSDPGGRAGTRPRESSGSYVAQPGGRAPLLIAAAVGAVLLIGAVILFVGRPGPTTTATADRSSGTIVTTTALPVTSWLLPEGGFALDLPVAPGETAPPDVPEPFVSAAAYTGTADGRTYLVASLVVHPAYRWADTGQAFIDALDALATKQGFALASRTAGATDELPSNRFTVLDARGPTESEVAFQTRKDGPATGEGVALISGNHLYVVLVRGTSLAQAQFRQILESIVVA